MGMVCGCGLYYMGVWLPVPDLGSKKLATMLIPSSPYVHNMMLVTMSIYYRCHIHHQEKLMAIFIKPCVDARIHACNLIRHAWMHGFGDVWHARRAKNSGLLGISND